MLEYEWAANPSAMMLDQEGSEEPAPAQPDYPTRQVFDHYSAAAHHHQLQLPPHPPSSALFPCSQTTSFFDPRGAAYPPPHHSFLSLDQISSANNNNPYFLVPKSEEVGDPHHLSSRMGLNLGGRTYFSSAEDDFVSRLYRRSLEPGGGGGGGASNPPRCQAEGCTADLTHAKHYHRRHKVCEFHSKASTVVAAGLTQRFCQQCSRFHVLTEFDNGKRSCRKRLADHNRRRRKSHQNAVNTLQQSQEAAAALKETGPADDSPSHNLTTARSPPSDSGVQSSSSVTVAVSPPRMFLDCFKQRPYHQGTAASSASSASSSSLFFLSG